MLPRRLGDEQPVVRIDLHHLVEVLGVELAVGVDDTSAAGREGPERLQGAAGGASEGEDGVGLRPRIVAGDVDGGAGHDDLLPGW